MSRDRKLRVLCYDVSSNKARRRIARSLENVTTRVQLSVFEGHLSTTELRRVVKEVSKLLGKGDSLRVYTIGQVGQRHCEVHGSAAPIDRDTGFWLL